MKKIYSLLAVATLLMVNSLHLNAQITCSPTGNLWVYANYDGGVLNINCDANIPNIKIGVCTYEPVTINLSGPYVGNVTEVHYAGYVSTNNMHCFNSPTTTTITGVSSTITSVNFLPPGVLNNPNGYSNIVCGYTCSTTTSQGGCNTADQIKAYFQTATGGTLVSYYTQYGCWSSTPYSLNAGGNCCNSVPTCFIAADAGVDVAMCAGDAVTLSGSATGGATVYSWTPTAGLSNPNSATTSASPLVTTTYVLTAGDGASCSDLDTIVVTVNPLPVVDLGADTSLCGGNIVLDAGVQSNGVYLWNNSSASQTLTASASGLYSVSVTNTLTGCTNADSISITVHAVPVVTLGNDTSICGDAFVLNAGNPGMTYLWSNNSTQQMTTVFATGTYSVVVTDANGCTATDATNITINAIPNVSFVTGTMIVCLSDQSFAFTTGSPAGGVYSGPGVTGNNFDPLAAGQGTHLITYTFTDTAGCSSFASDSITVDACLGTGGISAFAVQLFPNPSTGSFQVNVSQVCTAVLVNSLGQTVEEKTVYPGSNTLGDTKLAEGIYTLRITNAVRQEQVFRVVISR